MTRGRSIGIGRVVAGISGLGIGAAGIPGCVEIDRLHRGLVAEAKRARQELLGRLIARREAGLAPKAALASRALRRVLEFQAAPQRVRGLRQPPGRLLYLGHVVEHLSRLRAPAGKAQSLGLAEESALIVRSPGDGGRVLHQGFCQATQAEQGAAEARVRKSARRSDFRGGAVRCEGLVEAAAENGHVADSQRFLVALVQVVRHAYMMTSTKPRVPGT